MSGQDYVAALVTAVEMRAAQKAYFKARTPDLLIKSKALEKRFDEEATRLGIRPQGAGPDLFG